MNNKLKSCPFCGSYVLTITISVFSTKYQVKCLSCDIIGPSCDTRDEAVKKWNARHVTTGKE
jgi:Lar family restriction alleviation protein